MHKEYEVYQVDAFTSESFTGNPAGVVLNADGLTETEMQKIARELNNSETAFIFSSDSPDYDVHIRFFTPTSEVPVCGHATISAHYVRAVTLNLDSCVVRQKTQAGILPVEIIKQGKDYQIVMTQGKPEVGNSIVGQEKEELLSALQLEEGDLQGYDIQIASTGHSKVMIGIKDRNKLNSITPDFTKLAQLSSQIGCNGYYVFTLGNADVDDDNAMVHGRMFAPAIGINEDPVTGNANGPLGAYLVANNIVKTDVSSFSFTAIQGECMGRKGKIQVEVSIKEGQPEKVRIFGNAVIIFNTIINI